MMKKSVGVIMGMLLGSTLVYADPQEATGFCEESGYSVFDLGAADTEKKEEDQNDSLDPGEIENKTFLSAEEHKVQFWQDGKGQWRATVDENLPEGFSRGHDNLRVGFRDGWSLKRFAAMLQPKDQQQKLHVVFNEKGSQEAFVYVGGQGLPGGGTKHYSLDLFVSCVKFDVSVFLYSDGKSHVNVGSNNMNSRRKRYRVTVQFKQGKTVIYTWTLSDAYVTGKTHGSISRNFSVGSAVYNRATGIHVYVTTWNA